MTTDVPPQLARLVEIEPDGSIAFTRPVTDPRGAALRAVFAAPLLIAAVWALVAGPGGDLATLAGVMLLMAGGAFAPLAYIGRLHRIVRSVATRSELRGPGGFVWQPGERLELVGDVEARTASLVLVRPSGESVEVKDWKVLRHARTLGWDVEGVRWFAQRVARQAQLPLDDRLPDTKAWADADALREIPWEPGFDASYGATPVPAEPTWSHEGIGVLVPRSVSLGGELQGGVTIDVSPTRLRTTGVDLPIDTVHRIVPWFGMGLDGQEQTELAEIRAVLDHRTVLLARRRVDRVPPGVVHGIVAALEQARTAAQARDDGDRSDVPATMARLAQRARVPER